MFPEPTELLLIGCSIESIWTPKIQIKYIDTENQLADILTIGNFTRDEWNHLLCLFEHQPFQFYSLFWSHGKKITTRFRRRTSHSNIATKDELYCKGAIERIIFDFSKPGEEKLWKSKSWSTIAEKEKGSGRPDVGSDRKTASDYYHEQFIEISPQQATQSVMITILGLLKSGKLILRCANDRWKTRESQPGFSHGQTQHDGTAQSIVNEAIPRDSPGRPDVDLQRGARPQQFFIGNDETELELSVESRSFVNQVNDQVRKRQKRISNVTRDGEEHSLIWWMFMAVTMESAVFIGKVLEQLSIHCEHKRSHTQTIVRHIYKIGVWARWDLWIGNNWLGKSFMEITCHWLVTKESSIFNARRSTSFRILCCALGRFSKTINLTMHGKKDWDGWNLLQNTETLTESTVSQWNSSGIFPRIQYVAAQLRSQKFTVEIRQDTREFHRKDHIYVNVQWHQKTMKKNAWRMPYSFLSIFVPTSWMCKKETSVSHSSTESEIISMDAGLRLDGIPALDLGDLIVSVLGNTTQNHDRTVRPVVNGDTDQGSNKRSQGMTNVLNNIDCVPSNVQSSHQEALLLIIKGRSPTMRHVSRTHRVTLGWLFDRINLDHQNPNQIHWHQKPTRRHTDQGKFHT